MQALGAMRYERGVQALTDLFQYLRQGRRGGSGARRAGAHRASVQRAAVRRAAGRQERRAARHRDRRAGASRRRVAAGARFRRRSTRSASDERRARRRLRAASLLGNGPTDQVAEALDAAAAARAGASGIWSRSRRAAPRRSHASCRIPTRDIRVDVIDALGARRRSGGDAAVEPLMQDRDPQVARRPRSAPSRGVTSRSARKAPSIAAASAHVRETAASLLRSPDPRRRPRSARQGARAQSPRRRAPAA